MMIPDGADCKTTACRANFVKLPAGITEVNQYREADNAIYAQFFCFRRQNRGCVSFCSIRTRAISGAAWEAAAPRTTADREVWTMGAGPLHCNLGVRGMRILS
jgi:hypothetical protein